MSVTSFPALYPQLIHELMTTNRLEKVVTHILASILVHVNLVTRIAGTALLLVLLPVLTPGIPGLSEWLVWLGRDRKVLAVIILFAPVCVCVWVLYAVNAVTGEMPCVLNGVRTKMMLTMTCK